MSELESTPQTGLSTAMELDCRGLNCPLPIIKTKKAINSLAAGDVLKIVCTDPGSVPDFAAFSRRTGHQVVEQSEAGGEFTFYIQVS